MRPIHRGSLAPVVACVLCLAGCGKTVEFVQPDHPRDPLKSGFHTTYTFRYKVEASGWFSSATLESPRLLYAEGEADFESDPAAFRDTGAPFDQEKGAIEWRIPNLRALQGKSLRFVIDAEGLDRRPALRVDFPNPGRVLSADPEVRGNRVRFTVRHAGEVFGVRFLARIGRTRTQEIRPAPEPGAPEGVLVFDWDPRADLDPADSAVPLGFSVEYETWYYETAAPFYTPPVRLPLSASFGEPEHREDGTLRIPAKVWGRPGVLSVWVAADAGFAPARGARVEDRGDGLAEIAWDLKDDGLLPLTRTVRYRLQSGESILAEGEVLPPRPGLKALAARQEGNLLLVLFEAAFADPEAVRVFAGSGSRQRRVADEEEVNRAKGLLAFRIDRLPVEEGPGGERFLTVFLSAENPAGTSSAEIRVPLVRVDLESVRQVQDEIELRASVSEGAVPEVAFRAGGAADWTPARGAARDGERWRWEFRKDLPSPLPAEIDLRLRAVRGDSFGEATARVAPLSVAARPAVARGGGVFEVPVAVEGKPDWVLLEYTLGGGPFLAARGALWDPASSTLRWNFWGDVSKAEYAGQDALLRASFRNPYGFYTIEAKDIRPAFVRLGAPAVQGKAVSVPLKSREGASLSFFVSTDAGRTFRPLPGVRLEPGRFEFDLAALGPLTGASLRVRVAAADPGGGLVEEDAEVRLPVGINQERAYWQAGMLWVAYEVDWKVSEKDVRIEFGVPREGGEASWEEASVPARKVYDVNGRGFCWDMARDLARAGRAQPQGLRLRLVISPAGQDPILRELPADGFPPMPVQGRKPALAAKNGRLHFTLGGLHVLPADAPASPDQYLVTAEFLDASTTHFRPATPARGVRAPDGFAWDRDQSLRPAAQGTWVKLTIAQKGNSRVTGFVLYRVRLADGHAFLAESSYTGPVAEDQGGEGEDEEGY